MYISTLPLFSTTKVREYNTTNKKTLKIQFPNLNKINTLQNASHLNGGFYN